MRKQCNNVLADRGDFKMVLQKIAQCFPEWHHAVPESAYFKVPETLKTFRMYCSRLPGMPPVPPDYIREPHGWSRG